MLNLAVMRKLLSRMRITRLRKWIAGFLTGWLITLTMGHPSLAFLSPSQSLNATSPVSSEPTLTRLAALPIDRAITNGGHDLSDAPAHTLIPADDITAGIAAFENGQFVAAIAHWQAAIAQLPANSEADRLTQASL